MTVDHSRLIHNRSGSMTTMRIAIAGTGGLARLIAFHIVKETSHQVVFLSRNAQPQLSNTFRVIQIDYDDQQSLVYALRGIHTVISTVTSPKQIELIKAAVKANVVRFAPAEFEGPPNRRAPDCVIERGRGLVRDWLAHYSQHMQSSVFICGMFYERFQPGGLRQSLLSLNDGMDEEGAYLINCRTMRARALLYIGQDDADPTVCLTSAVDVARFVTRALDLPRWPAEMRMSGERTTLRTLLLTMAQLRGLPVTTAQWYSKETLRTELRTALLQSQDKKRTGQAYDLWSIGEGYYDYTDCNLNTAFPDIQPTTFREWFYSKWSRESQS